MVKAKVGITQEVLEKVAKELNKILGLEKPDALAFSKKGGIESLKSDILEAAKELTEDDDVSKFTLGILKDLKSPSKKKEEKKEVKKEEKKVVEKKIGETKTEYIISLIKENKYTCKEIIQKTQSKFSEFSKASTASFLSHIKNPKYSLKGKVIKISKTGIIGF